MKINPVKGDWTFFSHIESIFAVIHSPGAIAWLQYYDDSCVLPTPSRQVLCLKLYSWKCQKRASKTTKKIIVEFFFLKFSSFSFNIQCNEYGNGWCLMDTSSLHKKIHKIFDFHGFFPKNCAIFFPHQTFTFSSSCFFVWNIYKYKCSLGTVK